MMQALSNDACNMFWQLHGFVSETFDMKSIENTILYDTLLHRHRVGNLPGHIQPGLVRSEERE